jgi:ABC-type nickel/cobalt efflux system permease component RcnA
VTSSRLERSDADGILPVAIGTAAWAIAFVVLLLMRSSLEEHGTTWWIGAAAVGLVSGLGGLLFLRWRKGRHEARLEAVEPDAQE